MVLEADDEVIGRIVTTVRSRRAGGPAVAIWKLPSNKKVGISADLVCWRSRNNARSVSRCDRRAVTAEAVVDAQGDHVHVLADPVVDKSGATGDDP